MTDKEFESFLKKGNGIIVKAANDINMIVNEDDIQTVFLELCRAYRKFDENRGCKFSTFAYKCAQNTLMKIIRSNKSAKSAMNREALSYDEQMTAQCSSYICDDFNEFEIVNIIIETTNSIINDEVLKKAVIEYMVTSIAYGNGYKGFISDLCKKYNYKNTSGSYLRIKRAVDKVLLQIKKENY